MLYGMDISAYQNPTPPIGDQDFVIVKATQNTTEDPLWSTHSAAVRRAGKFLIAYHFGEEAPAAPQVNKFLQVAQHADAWVLDRDPSYYSQSMHRWVHQPEPQTCREFIAGMRQLSFPCGLYFNCANYIDAGQDWNWQASPPEICPSIPWDIYQAHSGQPRGDICKLPDLNALLGGTRVQKFVVTMDEPHNITVPRGTHVHTLGGQFERATSETKPQIGLVRGRLSGSDANYWVVALQMSGDKQLGLVRVHDVTDNGKVAHGGGGGGNGDGSYDEGYAAAKNKAINAVENL